MSELTCEVLTDACYAVDPAEDGATADELMAINSYDLVILDWGIPGISGIDLLRKWRQEGRTIPILMLTARVGDESEILALQQGADDYLAKPVRPRVLLARLRVLLRRGRPDAANTGALRVGPLRLDEGRREASIHGGRLSLTDAEFRRVDRHLRATTIERHGPVRVVEPELVFEVLDAKALLPFEHERAFDLDEALEDDFGVLLGEPPDHAADAEERELEAVGLRALIAEKADPARDWPHDENDHECGDEVGPCPLGPEARADIAAKPKEDDG